MTRVHLSAVLNGPALASAQLNYYFGTPEQVATLDTANDYDRGEVEVSGPLTVDNSNPVTSARNATGPDDSRFYRVVTPQQP